MSGSRVSGMWPRRRSLVRIVILAFAGSAVFLTPSVGGAASRSMSASVTARWRIAATSAVESFAGGDSNGRMAVRGGPPTSPRDPRAGPEGTGAVILAWYPPVSDGGATVNGYAVTPYVGTTAQPRRVLNSTATIAVVRGLRNGVTYRFTIAARNRYGIGTASPKTSPITVSVPTSPGPPTATRIGRGHLSVSFTDAAANGATIIAYKAVCQSSNGGVTRHQNRTLGPIGVKTLTPGKIYTCTVRATNKYGSGPWSSRSNEATA